MEQQTVNPASSQSVSSLMQSLQQALALEAKFQPKLQLPSGPATGGVSSFSDSYVSKYSC
jgi:hypothetical protein